MERNGSGSRALFPRGPSFTLEDFSNKDFIVRDFVDSLAEGAVPINRRSGPAAQQAFDPKPLIRTFENALQGLVNLSEELQEKESDLQSKVRRAEVQHDQTLDTLGLKLDQSIRQFEDLDISLNNPSNIDRGSRNDPSGGGNIAVQIGEKLEELDRKRKRAQDANFLIQCWLEVSETGELTSLQDIQRQGGADNKVRCAVIAHQLMRISQRLDLAAWGQTNGNGRGVTNGVAGAFRSNYNTREVLEKFCETLEQDLLKQFNNSYRKQNFDDMMECAKVLHDFNGGSSVIAVFVNQHQFFIDRNQLITEEVTADGETFEQLADPDSDPPGVEPSLQSLIDEVKIIMQEESFIIKRAFPYYETVLIKFIQRIFQQSIQQRLEMVLEKADTISSLAFLRSLHSSRNYISALVEDLKAHGLTEHPEPCSAQISQTLDQQMEELFVPYIVGNSYIEREKKSLEETYNSLLFKYNIYHSRRKKAPTGFMASFGPAGFPTHGLGQRCAMMLRVAGVQETDKNKNDIEVSDQDGVLSTANAKRMMTWLAESVRRTLELGSPSDTPKDVATLLNLLMTSMGQVYVETGLDAALEKATAQENSKVEPDLSYMPSIRPAVTIASIMSRFITTVLIRLAESNTTVRRSMEAQSKMGIESIEKKTNNIMKSTIDVLVNWVAKSLASQKKVDYLPKDDSVLETLQTPTCNAICSFLSRAFTLTSQAIDGTNLEVFSSELALSIQRLLIDHYKKYKINAAGGLMVTKDISKYVATLKEWNLNKDAGASVELLTEIGYLFIIGPEALRERSRNLATGPSGGSKKLAKADFKTFIQNREDYKSVGIQSVLSGL
ncbi:exocyst complex component sec10 [Apiospora kogelbergensis]|uniref:exocyst complex component sec10 n=1 Tax=Apiospora kogelbergensis TaxID=1337665 RepID=UPI00312E965A